MKVLLDVNIVIDLCAERYPFSRNATQVFGWCKENSIPLYLYTGSVQTLIYSLATQIHEPHRSFSESLKIAKEELNKLSGKISW
ncbi:hypothetical protein ES705_29566 [subsurface metagenome]